MIIRSFCACPWRRPATTIVWVPTRLLRRIVSIFLGDELGAIVDALISDKEYTSAERVATDLGVAVLPNFLKDNTDRNRTSPFAFTGNKFEFRMPGSAVNLSDANTILNTAMAKSLKEFADAMEGKFWDEFRRCHCFIS